MAPSPTPSAITLSELPLLRPLLRWLWFPYVFQIAMLAVVVSLAMLGLQSSVPEGVESKLVAKGTLVTLLVWGLWWPTMIWTAVIVGRVWCTVCPLELVANITERVARRLGVGGRTLGRVLRGGWVALALYLAMQMLVAGAEMHRSAWLTGVMMLGLVGLAGATAAIYRDRAFCRGFCPVSLLLGSYGRYGSVAMRAESPTVCVECADHRCTDASLRAAVDARSCPSLLDPSRLQSNADCLVCGQCVKVCSGDTMRMLLRTPFDRRDVRETAPRWPLALFVMTASGFVTAEIAAEWPAAKAAVAWAPHALASALGAQSLGGWIDGLWVLAAIPAILWLLFGIIAAEGRIGRFGESVRALALPMVVIVASAHMAKAFVKATSWAGFLPGALDDPTNAALSSSIAAELIAKPAALVTTETASVVGLALVVAGFGLAIRELRLGGSLRIATVIPTVLLAALYLVIIAGWGG
jgi:ferredoxin